jgi:hypothetical protein
VAPQTKISHSDANRAISEYDHNFILNWHTNVMETLICFMSGRSNGITQSVPAVLDGSFDPEILDHDSEPDPIVGRMNQILLRAQVPFGRLHRRMSQ